MQPNDQAGPPATPFLSRLRAPLPVYLCLIVLAVFLPALGNGFVDWDDVQYVVSNPALRGSWLDALAFSPGYYHPLTTLTYKLEFVLFGLNPLPYHFTSLALHLAVCVSAFRLLTALGARRGTAFLAALLFGIHPVHVEPAAWISGRKELLWGLFSCWTLTFYLRFLDTRLKKYFLWSLAFFALAVLSKPFAAVLPFVILLCDRYRDRAFSFRLLAEKVPYLAIALPLITLSTGPSGFLLESGAGSFSLAWSAASAVQNAFFYAQKLLLPFSLSSLYPSQVLSWGALLLPGALLLSAFGALRLVKARDPEAGKIVFFGLGFFLVTLLPALLVSPPADRYDYLPALGLLFIYAEFLFRFYGALRGPAAEGRAPLASRLLVAAAAAHFCLLGAASAQRATVWKTSLALWEDVLEKYPLEAVAYYGRGNARAAAGEYDGSLRDFTRCLELSPLYWKALNNRARLFTDGKEFDKAIADYSAAIALNPREPRLFLNRGNAYFMKGDPARAVKDYDLALALAPGLAPAIENKRRAGAGSSGPKAAGAGF
ncbi:MAG: tetratricopeptide repeat protein [Elusimicrobiales bacterium]|nr:tetratricopeptide repeat protein [Elusimicrobiales bacterium]